MRLQLKLYFYLALSPVFPSFLHVFLQTTLSINDPAHDQSWHERKTYLSLMLQIFLSSWLDWKIMWDHHRLAWIKHKGETKQFKSKVVRDEARQIKQDKAYMVLCAKSRYLAFVENVQDLRQVTNISVPVLPFISYVNGRQRVRII